MFAALILSLLNVGLVAVPIGGAVGTLAGIDYYRRINGQTPLWYGSDTGSGAGAGSGGSSSGGGGNGDTGGNYTGGSNYTWPGNEPNKTTVKGGVTIAEYCQQYATVNISSTTGQNYTLNPNQWGWTKSEGGGLCMNVTSFNNHTYATNTTAPQWSATWKYKAGSPQQPVHAYPNIMINGGVLPVKLSNVSMMRLDVLWAYVDAGTAVVGTAAGAKTRPPEVSSSTTASAASATKAAATSEEDTPAAAPSTTTTKAAAAPTTTKPTAAAAAEAPSSAPAKAASSAAKAPVSVAKAPASTAKAEPAASSAAASKPAKQASTKTGDTKEAAPSKAVVAGRSFNDVTFSANVAVDMFFDANAASASLTGKATYEVMVWLAQFGEYTDPIGIADGAVAWQVVNGVNFTLFAGTNGKKQHVLTWIAETAAPAFNGSILPLITSLPSLGLKAYPTLADYMGYFAFGSETYYSVDEVTFDVERLSMDIW
ncbi:hypothetical protein SEPCBS119000_004558 [Sporothrix epigloea]|uniref:Uncharacterized protein n=1 Tax=Sporothrix epigloea TaxID=1892477 RepID=A0ABP0DUX1_9PEZI